MTLPVPIDALAEELDCAPEEACVYVSPETGEFLTILNSDMGVIEEGDETDGFEWDWSPEDVAKLREIAERDEKWIAMPDKFEIHEWAIMKAFADQQREPLSSNLQSAIRGRGAFRAFRAVLESAGRTEAWYEFKASSPTTQASGCKNLPEPSASGPPDQPGLFMKVAATRPSE